MGLFNLFKPARTVLVIDMLSLFDSLGMKGKVPPRNQLQVLRRLSRFAEREKLETVAVMNGTPLNKAPAGKKFEGVVVVYSSSLDGHAKYVCQVAGSKGAGAVLISANATTEKHASGSVKKMRISTFRKVFDMGGDSDSSDRGSNSGRNRSQRRRKSSPQQQQNRNNNERSEPPPRPEKEMSESDAINELIDLVD